VAPFSFSERKKSSRNSRSSSGSERKKSAERKSNRSTGRESIKDSANSSRKFAGKNSKRDSKFSSQREKRPEKVKGPHERERNFARPWVDQEITGEEIDKKIKFQLESLTPGNAKSVARHMVALEKLLEINPLEAHQHGKEIVYRAGRLGIVREKAGIAALRAGEFQIAQKDLRAASRITGSKEILPYIAQCEVALGNPRKALEIAGKIKESELSREGRVEMRIAAAGARSALGEHDAAVLTLTCAELNEKDAAWSLRLHRAYRDALLAAGRKNEVQAFERTHPQLVQ
jgi:tetratricopeptide (TPR) repeat protein